MQFAATAATIVSGAVAERCKFEGYIAYAIFLTSWVYPVVVHCTLPDLLPGAYALWDITQVPRLVWDMTQVPRGSATQSLLDLHLWFEPRKWLSSALGLRQVVGILSLLVGAGVWSGTGWLSAFRPDSVLFSTGMVDFAGCSVVHMVGGFAGLAGAICVGPRIGKFDADGKVCAPRNAVNHNLSAVSW